MDKMEDKLFYRVKKTPKEGYTDIIYNVNLNLNYDLNITFLPTGQIGSLFLRQRGIDTKPVNLCVIRDLSIREINMNLLEEVCKQEKISTSRVNGLLTEEEMNSEEGEKYYLQDKDYIAAVESYKDDKNPNDPKIRWYYKITTRILNREFAYERYFEVATIAPDDGSVGFAINKIVFAV